MTIPLLSSVHPEGVAIIIFNVIVFFFLQKSDGIGKKYGGAISGWLSLIFTTWVFQFIGVLSISVFWATSVSLFSAFGIIAAFYCALNDGPDHLFFKWFNSIAIVVGWVTTGVLTLFA